MTVMPQPAWTVREGWIFRGVNIQKGAGVLNIDEGKHLLERGNVFIIPEKQVHSLELRSDFKALVIMENDSEIEFDT